MKKTKPFRDPRYGSLNKIFLIMRIATFLMIFGLLQAYASDTYSQKTKLSLDLQDTELIKVLDKIEMESEFFFLFNEKLLDTDRMVNISANNQPIHVVLDNLFAGTDVEYSIIDRKIILAPDFLLKSEQLIQQRTVSGIVTDNYGEPIPGVNVVVYGTNQGTITDVNGKYVIEVPEGGESLEFSFVGYESQNVVIGTQTLINIVLRESLIDLEEVIIVGYGTMKKSDLTGAVASIHSEDLNTVQATAPERLMQGKIAGVDIIQSSGRPGATATIRVRGTTSISAGNDPLYVVDGIPMQFNSTNSFVSVLGEGSTSPFSSERLNPLNTINPSDIESITILKDASATAIYGSRGANGVVMITTKSKSGPAETLSYDTYFSLSSVRKKLPFLTADEYRNYAQDNGLSFPDEGAETDWQNEIYRTGLSHNHNLTFGGGAQNSTYRASLGYSNQQGVILSSKLQKFTSRLNANHSALDGRLDIQLNLNYGKVLNEDVPVSSNINNEGGNMLKDGLRWAPTLPVYNPDGSYYQIGPLRVNPVSWIEIIDDTDTENIIGNASFSYKILDPLKVSVNLGYTNDIIERYNYVPGSHPIGEAENGRAAISKLKNYGTTIETTLNYSKDLSESSTLNALVGYSFYRYVHQSTSSSANDFISDATTWNLIQSGTVLSNTSHKSANRLSSVFSRINYGLLDRYFLTVTIRGDGSSRFGENNRWGLFPSGAFAWNISNEPFFTIEKINDLKLRLGYGVTGNQEIPDNLYREQYSVGGTAIYVLGGQAVASVNPSNFPNPDLQWEQTSQLNVGLDFGLFGNRVYGTIDVYRKLTDNLLLEFSTVAPSVVSTQWANVGEIENKGIEFTLDGTIINTTNFHWDANINFSRNVNEVLSLSNENFSRDEILTGRTSGVVSPAESPCQVIRAGLPIGTFLGREYTGLDENGMETYQDVDGVEDAEVVIGNAYPDFIYGFTNSFRWKRFSASLTLRGVVGNDIFNNTAAEFGYPSAVPGTNVLQSAIESGLSRSQTAQYSSRWIEKGSYMRLDNLTIGYNFNTDNIPFLSRARIYINGQNLFVLTGYSGFDPEVRTNTERGGIPPIGIDYLAYPMPRVFMVGANLSF